MTAENFSYWLKGYFELLSAGPKTGEKLVLTAEQVEMIQQHLNYVFAEKVTSSPPQGITFPFGGHSGDLVLGPYGGTSIC